LASALTVPSPKFHRYELTVPVDWLVNCTVTGAVPVVRFGVNAAMGALGLWALICCETLELPPVPDTVRVTV
jgi:hypothetical protein